MESLVGLERRESLSFQLLVRCGKVDMVKHIDTDAWSEIDAVPMLAERRRGRWK